jgi:hypothetical protein
MTDHVVAVCTHLTVKGLIDVGFVYVLRDLSLTSRYIINARYTSGAQ